MIHCRAEILPFLSKAHIQSIGLRYDVLRKPLGLLFSAEELRGESEEIIMGLLRGEYVVACLQLKRVGTGLFKMRQVAVVPDEQGRGHGRELVNFCENWCREQGISAIELHARETAILFYLSLGYVIDKEPFEEVGIPHRYMIKTLA